MSRSSMLPRRAGRFVATVSLATMAMCGLAGSAAAQSSASPYTTGYRYDAERRLVGTISPDPNTSANARFDADRYTFDADGKLTLIEKGVLTSWQPETVLPINWSGFSVLETTAVAYDAVGNKVEERRTSAAGGSAVQGVVQASYDPDDRLQCTAVRMNLGSVPATGSDACAQGSQPGSFGPDRIEKKIYDTADQLAQVRQGVGTSLEQAYATYSYTGNGNQNQVVDANGNRATLVWDGFDRKLQWRFPSPARPASFDPSTPANALASAGSTNIADYEQYGYDATGNRNSLRKRGGETLTFGYDALNRMTSKTVPATAAAQAYAVGYGYDLVGRRLSATFANGLGVTNAYDNADRVTSSTNNSTGPSRQLSYGYDANGNRTQVTHPDGAYFTYGYDGLNRATSITENGGTTLASLQYDDLGRRMSMGRLGGTANTVYGYDGAGRLQTLTHDLAGSNADITYTLTYNPAGQAVSRSTSNDTYAYTGNANDTRGYSVDGLNRYGQAGGAALSYDGDGNTTGNGAGTAFGYDGENRLVSASGGRVASLQYDPLGRLMRTSGGAAGSSDLLYDGDALVAEYDGSGNVVNRYVHGPGVDEPVTWYEGGAVTASARRGLVADAQGSIVAVTDASGNSVAINSYDAWGLANQGAKGRFLYTGQIMIPELGLYHYRARAYSAKLGRFLQTDPVGYDDQVNLYAYVANDPVNHTDPTGTSCQTDKDGRPTSCKIDSVVLPKGQSSMTTRQAAAAQRYERNYTRAAQRTFDNNKTVRVGETGGRKGTSFIVTGREVARSLAARSMTYRPGQPNGNAGIDTGGNPLTQRIFSNVYDREMAQSDTQQQQDTAHDGIHSTDSERLGNGLSPVLGLEPYATEHQAPYNQAGADLLNPR